MTINNAPKLFGILFICVLVTMLLLFDRIDAVAGAGILGTAIGYLAGNGVAARAGDPIVPVFREPDHGYMCSFCGEHHACPTCHHLFPHGASQCLSCQAPLG